ncbi:Acyl-CoA synthetase [Ignavibacterium album JCM 16511]|uniref:Acyl-CoA synthetase n=1 Tax=Ignavibacterium album (strain DSM 19864 / JCM 16511 / NBRC 101810 / Mat9-16) TaxID=945713 RepID=I0AMI8_IGNAJ|nr:AMP-binding protein [Ignavibacterium album]AFH50195.1 Acyl-CoA synthetase [Ignavibacterium album JCM 16511]
MKNYFWETLRNYRNKTALIEADSETSVTYSELDELSDEIAEQLISEDKKLVFLFTDNSIDSLVAYLSVLKSGDAVLLLDDKLNYEIRDNLISIYKPSIIINQNEEVEGYRNKPFGRLTNCLFRIERPKIKLHPSLKVLLSTSGTTGSPKLVRLSADNIQSNADSIAQYLEIVQNEKPITTLPFNYSYGLSVINSHLLKGSTIVMTNKTVFFKDFWNTFKKFECTSFAGVPYTYQMLKRTGFDKLDLPSLKTMTQAGGKLNEEMIKYFYEYAEKKNVRFFVMYGQTEATARISYVPFEMLKNKIGSIGISIPSGKLSLMNDGIEITQPHQVGEIVYEGENVMLGYAETLDDLSKGDEMNGKLFTGDLGYFDEDGYFYVTGRMKRFIKMFGLRINLDEVQKMIENHFHFAAACTGEDEKLRILIQTVDEADVKVKQKVCETYKLNPSTVVVKQTDNIPTKSSGKYDYEKINSMF